MNQDGRRLQRSRRDKKVAGVAGGLADYFGIDATILRVLFVILAFTGGPGLILYIALWLILPLESGY